MGRQTLGDFWKETEKKQYIFAFPTVGLSDAVTKSFQISQARRKKQQQAVYSVF